MRVYFAPMEGLTDSIYRRLHARYFPGVDRYYTPFFSPTVHRSLTPREARELPETSDDRCVPQILTKEPGDFLWLAKVCRDRGYGEVNLNLGCPSGTVTAKGKGAGMLRDPEALDRFLERIFAEAPLPVSVKTRIGWEDPAEFPALLAVLNRYPVKELILHPRVRADFYDHPVRTEALDYALTNAKMPICYNGNLCSRWDIDAFAGTYSGVQAAMVGRGLIGDPGMLSPGGTTRDALAGFYDELLEEYLTAFGGSRNAMFRLKENWRYLLCRFEDSEKAGKQLRKTTDLAEYRTLTAHIIRDLPMKDRLMPDW